MTKLKIERDQTLVLEIPIPEDVDLFSGMLDALIECLGKIHSLRKTARKEK